MGNSISVGWTSSALVMSSVLLAIVLWRSGLAAPVAVGLALPVPVLLVLATGRQWLPRRGIIGGTVAFICVTLVIDALILSGVW